VEQYSEEKQHWGTTIQQQHPYSYVFSSVLSCTSWALHTVKRERAQKGRFSCYYWSSCISTFALSVQMLLTSSYYIQLLDAEEAPTKSSKGFSFLPLKIKKPSFHINSLFK